MYLQKLQIILFCKPELFFPKQHQRNLFKIIPMKFHRFKSNSNRFAQRITVTHEEIKGNAIVLSPFSSARFKEFS